MSSPLVLVSGATGFVATHVVKLLQEQGYRVRGTVRSLKDEKKVKHLYNLCPNAEHKLELVEADLLNEDSWKVAVKDVKFIMHVASPFPPGNPKNEDEVILPAVNGTLNVLKAAADAGTVERVVLTSSCAAVSRICGNTTPYTENDWTDDSPETSAYYKSKLRAEKAAWNFLKELPHGKKFELATVNPSLVIGPPLHGSPGTSTDFMKKILEHEYPAVPQFHLAVIDVRDVALAHLKCMTLPDAVGHRHITSNRSITMPEIADIFNEEFKSQGYNIPTKRLPGCIVTAMSWFSSETKAAKDFGSKELKLDNSRLRNVLGIEPRDVRESLIDMAYALIDGGFVKKTKQYKGRPAQ